MKNLFHYSLRRIICVEKHKKAIQFFVISFKKKKDLSMWEEEIERKAFGEKPMSVDTIQMLRKY